MTGRRSDQGCGPVSEANRRLKLITRSARRRSGGRAGEVAATGAVRAAVTAAAAACRAVRRLSDGLGTDTGTAPPGAGSAAGVTFLPEKRVPVIAPPAAGPRWPENTAAVARTVRSSLVRLLGYRPLPNLPG
ncbi:hypothetical protein GCM10018779_15860 [Streptomyces griseocarneus]|nr:hypothetical protein GCM10018779_15860 [Streptomyces griseocarneus]